MSRKIAKPIPRSTVSAVRHARISGHWLALVAISLTTIALSGHSLKAQNAAASGMSIGTSADQELEQLRLMRIRAEAQKSRPEVQAAQMENSAAQALVQQQDNKALLEARAIREAKENAVREARAREAANAYQGISSGQIQSWSDQNTGNVKVQRNVPLAVQAELAAQEEARLKKEGGDPKKPGFFRAPGKAIKGALGWEDENAPPSSAMDEKKHDGILSGFRKDDRPAGIASTEEKKDGFFKKKTPQEGPQSQAYADSTGEEKQGFLHRVGEKIPFVGKKKETETSAPTIPAFPMPSVAGDTSGPAPAGSSTVEPPEPEKQGFLHRMTSNLPFVGDKEKKAEIDQGVFGPSSTAPAEMVPEKEKKGLFSRIGKNKEDEMASSSLFPSSGDASVIAQGNSEQGLGKFMPKLPKLGEMSLPKLGGDKPAQVASVSPSEPEVPKLKGVTKTPVHSGGSDLYVLKEDSQFMQFGASALSSEATTLSAGTVVRMTKVGDDWSSIQLSSGSEGVVRNGVLRPASNGEGTGLSFASARDRQTMPDTARSSPAPKTNPPVLSPKTLPARITSTVSAAQNEADRGNALPTLGAPAPSSSGADPLSELPLFGVPSANAQPSETVALP